LEVMESGIVLRGTTDYKTPARVCRVPTDIASR